MATGIQISDSKRNIVVRLVDGDTATNGVPSGPPSATPAATVGFALSALDMGNLLPSEATLRVRSTAGSGAMAATVKLWNYTAESGVWTPAGIGAGASKGTINGGASIDEGPSSDLIRHSEPITCLHHFDGVYAEITAIAGTSTALVIELVIPRSLRS